jgi:hypothetical protein
MKLSKYDLKLIWLILILTCIVFILNVYKNTKTINCFTNQSFINKIIILLITLIHIVVVLFLFCGWLFFNKKILLVYLVFQLCLMLHWITNEWKCKLSQIVNNICKFEDSLIFYDNSMLIVDFVNFLGISKLNKYKYCSNYYLFIYFYITAFCIAFYKLQK